MSKTQADDRPVSVRERILITAGLVAALTCVGVPTAVAAHDAQVQAAAAKAMTAAVPAYQGAIELGGSLDQLAVQSVQAKQAYDAEQARIAAQKAAEAAAAQAAAAAAAQQAAAQAAAQQHAAKQQTAQAATIQSSPTPSSVPLVATPGSSDTGRYNTSGCGSAGATTNPDGSVTCAG